MKKLIVSKAQYASTTIPNDQKMVEVAEPVIIDIATIYLQAGHVVVESEFPDDKKYLESKIAQLTHHEITDDTDGIELIAVLASSKSDIAMYVRWAEKLSDATALPAGLVTSSISFGDHAFVHGMKPVAVEDPEFLDGLWGMLQIHTSPEYWIMPYRE